MYPRAILIIIAYAMQGIQIHIEEKRKELETAKNEKEKTKLEEQIWELEFAIKNAEQIEDIMNHPDNFYRTVIDSPEWELWTKHQEELHKNEDFENVFAVWDSIEIGRISPQHFKAFLEFVKTS